MWKEVPRLVVEIPELSHETNSASILPRVQLSGVTILVDDNSNTAALQVHVCIDMYVGIPSVKLFLCDQPCTWYSLHCS